MPAETADTAETVDTWIERWVGQQRTALHVEGSSISYEDLAERIAQTASGLAGEGVEAGDRVAYCGLNRVEIFELLFACARIGAILLPLNNRLSTAELAWQIEHSSPRLLVTTDGFDQHLTEAGNGRRLRDLDESPFAGIDGAPQNTHRAAVDLDDDLLMVYTSGTTGKPKGSVLTQRAILHTVLNGVAYQGLSGDDVIVAPLPTFHVGGLNIHTLPALYVGAEVILQRRFDPGAVLDAIRTHRPTQTLLVPAMLSAVAGHPDFATTDLTCLTGISTGSSVVAEAVMAPFFDRGIPVAQVYGATETGPTAIAMPYAEAAARPTSCGRACAHTEVRVVDPDSGEDVAVGDEGEIWLQGPNLFSRYWHDEAATVSTHEDGWYKTGDVGFADAEGYYWISDRLTDMVISGGENVYPAEVEQVLAQHPEIADVAVVGRHDLRWGEAVVAVVVPSGDDDVAIESVREFCTDRLARFKQPTDVINLPALPKTALGKVQKHLLRAELGL